MDARSFLQVGTCLRQMFTRGVVAVSDDKSEYPNRNIRQDIRPHRATHTQASALAFSHQ